MTSRYYVLGIQPGAREGAGRLPQAQGQGRAQGREALAPPRLLRAQRSGCRADEAAAPVRPRRAGRHGGGPQRRALHQPVPAVPVAGRQADARAGGPGAARLAALGGERAGAARGVRLRRGRRRRRPRPPRAEPEARAGAGRPRGAGARRLGLRDLRGAARPLHDPDHGARGDERQERRAHPRRDGAALRRALGVRAAAARARRAGALAQARDRPRPGRRRRRGAALPRRRVRRSSRARASRSIRAVASGWC